MIGLRAPKPPLPPASTTQNPPGLGEFLSTASRLPLFWHRLDPWLRRFGLVVPWHPNSLSPNQSHPSVFPGSPLAIMWR